jgi:dephospho-CoA kinase
MIKLGLTGSLGMGKSTVAGMFEAFGVPVFDADAAVHRLQGPGGVLVPLIERRFPGSTRGDAVDRDALSLHVLGNQEKLDALEAIVHPAAQQARQRFAEAHSNARALLFEIPLLFETGSADQFDKVIVVSAPAEIQRTRALARSGMTPAKFEAILARQMSDSEKRARADFVIDTGADLSTTEAQVREILACLGLARGG